MKKIFWNVLVALSLTGCATGISYLSYTNQKYPPKPKEYPVSIYSLSQHLPVTTPFTIIGKVETQGYASDGTSWSYLTQEAISVARKKGADAIINANSRTIPYRGIYLIPGHFGYYHYHPARYIPYENSLLDFTGDLVIFKPASK